MTAPAERFICLALLLLSPLVSTAAIIGTNPPARPLTADRIATLPHPEQRAWMDYLHRSERQLAADQAQLQAEARAHGLKDFSLPPETRGTRGIPLDKPADWYGQPEARHLADNILSFQTPAGGWSKNLDMTQHPRAAGERFAHANASHFPGAADFDTPTAPEWSYVGTFDNDATITQLRYLARVTAANGSSPSEKYGRGFLRGLDYIFAAQYPNGGWPQVWPLQGGYHDAITYNDDAMSSILNLLSDVASGKSDLAFVPSATRKRARATLERGIHCLLATQIVVNGRRTVWCQQHDMLTLAPTSARNYEMPCEASSESAEIMLFLMRIPNANPDIVTAVHAAAAWFEKTKIPDVAYHRFDTEPRLVAAPGNGPLWARYYQIGIDRPLFGDRDKSIHDTVDEISLERRRGYGWYRDTPAVALQVYAQWNQQNPSQTQETPKPKAGGYPKPLRSPKSG